MKKKKTKAGGKISDRQLSSIHHMNDTEKESDFNANDAKKKLNEEFKAF